MAEELFNRKSEKKNQCSEPKILNQEELLKWWPFHRVDGRSLEKLQKQEVLKRSEESLF